MHLHSVLLPLQVCGLWMALHLQRVDVGPRTRIVNVGRRLEYRSARCSGTKSANLRTERVALLLLAFEFHLLGSVGARSWILVPFLGLIAVQHCVERCNTKFLKFTVPYFSRISFVSYCD